MAETETNVGPEASPAVAAAATAAAETAEAIATVAENAEAAIERAEARVEAAEETNELLAQAAIHTELGNRVAACEGIVNLCQTEMTTLKTMLAEMTLANTAMAAELLALKSAPPSVLIPQAPPAQTAEIIPLTPGGNVDPMQAANGENITREEAPPAPPPKKKRFV